MRAYTGKLCSLALKVVVAVMARVPRIRDLHRATVTRTQTWRAAVHVQKKAIKSRRLPQVCMCVCVCVCVYVYMHMHVIYICIHIYIYIYM